MAQIHGTPDSDHSRVSESQDQPLAKASGHTCMLRTDWRRVEYFPFDQLNMIVTCQHARGHHLLVAIVIRIRAGECTLFIEPQ
jgi:hypothetical protein